LAKQKKVACCRATPGDVDFDVCHSCFDKLSTNGLLKFFGYRFMQIISNIAELRTRLSNERAIAFVPTMGNLHEGHLNLMRLAREHGSCVVASIFVNPLQFGPNEDFDKYPRTLEADCAALQGLADVVFAPSVNEMYPEKQTVFVEPPPIANELDGASRPGHFRGMATVVLKLLNIVQPQVALFGKKDYQQLHIIRQMVEQLNLPVRIVGGETVRAADGLALSSRNQYLSDKERSEAIFLYQALQYFRSGILQGERDFECLRQQVVKELTERGWVVDYVAVRNQSDLLPASAEQSEWVILAAARLGDTRLIDNVEVSLHD
jgi:pantoate--beta-alanine ligase